MTRVLIKQVRSGIDRSEKQKRTLKALGLRKINGEAEHELNDTIRGMIFRVSHLVEVRELDGLHQDQDTKIVEMASVAGVVSEEE